MFKLSNALFTTVGKLSIRDIGRYMKSSSLYLSFCRFKIDRNQAAKATSKLSADGRISTKKIRAQSRILPSSVSYGRHVSSHAYRSLIYSQLAKYEVMSDPVYAGTCWHRQELREKSWRGPPISITDSLIIESHQLNQLITKLIRPTVPY